MYKLPENIRLRADSALNLCMGESFQLKLSDDQNLLNCNNYQWKKNGNDIIDATTNVYSVSDPGIYSVNFTCGDCGNVTLGQCNVICTSTANVMTPGFLVYPNPTIDKLNIQLDNIDQATISIYNALGQIIISQNIYNKNSSVDISTITDGLYYISLHNGTQTVKQKIIKNAH